MASMLQDSMPVLNLTEKCDPLAVNMQIDVAEQDSEFLQREWWLAPKPDCGVVVPLFHKNRHSAIQAYFAENWECSAYRPDHLRFARLLQDNGSVNFGSSVIPDRNPASLVGLHDKSPLHVRVFQILCPLLQLQDLLRLSEQTELKAYFCLKLCQADVTFARSRVIAWVSQKQFSVPAY